MHIVKKETVLFRITSRSVCTCECVPLSGDRHPPTPLRTAVVLVKVPGEEE